MGNNNDMNIGKLYDKRNRRDRIGHANNFKKKETITTYIGNGSYIESIYIEIIMVEIFL